MTIQTEKFERKPFFVDAIQVTEENIEDVARWCNGELQEDDNGKRFVHVRVHRPLTPRQTQAYVGDWVLYAGRGYKVYKKQAFEKSFQSVWKEPKRPVPGPPAQTYVDPDPPQTAGEIVDQLDISEIVPEELHETITADQVAEENNLV